MELINENFHEEKKSKFYGYLYKIDTKEDIIILLKEIKLKYKNLRHLPYAYYLNNIAGKTNDHEPVPIGLSLFNILERENLNNHLLLVVRIYGGTKLGASNLLRVYTKVANKIIKK